MAPTADRRIGARCALETYVAQPGLDAGDPMANLADLIADLLHLADGTRGEDNEIITGERALTVARMQYDAEKEDEGAGT